jgi:hypothetical protein
MFPAAFTGYIFDCFHSPSANYASMHVHEVKPTPSFVTDLVMMM